MIRLRADDEIARYVAIEQPLAPDERETMIRLLGTLAHAGQQEGHRNRQDAKCHCRHGGGENQNGQIGPINHRGVRPP